MSPGVGPPSQRRCDMILTQSEEKYERNLSPTRPKCHRHCQSTDRTLSCQLTHYSAYACTACMNSIRMTASANQRRPRVYGTAELWSAVPPHACDQSRLCAIFLMTIHILCVLSLKILPSVCKFTMLITRNEKLSTKATNSRSRTCSIL